MRGSKRAMRFAIVASITIASIILAIRLSGIAAPERRDAVSTLITDRHGVPLRELLSVDEGRNRWVNYEDISPHMVAATVAAEDKRFYRHIGIDPLALTRAVYANIRAGRVVSGGSTITQQLARMLHPAPRTLATKAREALHALWLELMLSKKDILEHYLNRAPYGNQLFGVDAAARMYFDKPSRDLSIAESAYLAILPRAPGAYNPYRGRTAMLHRRRALIERMHARGSITAVERAGALAEPLALEPRRYAFAAPHFVDMLSPQPVGGELRTSLDIGLQRRIEDIIARQLEALERYNVRNAAVVVVDNATAEIRALAGSADFMDEAGDGQVNGATARRQPGSALKPFLYALALEQGYTPASIIPDIPVSFPTNRGDYAPRNYDLRFRGPVRLRTALANSLNVPAVQLTARIGAANLLRMLRDTGFASLDREPAHYGLGLALGNGEVTLMELAAAYAMLARGGVYVPLTPFPRTAVPHGARIIAPAAAYLVADILSDDAARRMSFGENSPLDLPFRAAAKTGTSKNFRDNWTVGFTADHTVAVWAGNFDGAPMKGASGITGAAPIFRAVMLALAERTPPAWLEEPPGIRVDAICPLSGMHPAEHCPATIEERFAAGSRPTRTCAFHVEHAVDIRNGLLATEACDSSRIRVRSFIDLPDRYRDWARAYDIPLKPRAYSPHCAPERNGRGVDVAAAPSITHPRNGSVYRIDHHTPRRLQALTLAAHADAPLIWRIDGARISRTLPPHRLSWKIEKGRHAITIAAESGTVLDRIEVTVR